MRFLVLAIVSCGIFFISSTAIYAQKTCFRTGSFTNCTDGTSYIDAGNLRFYNDGSSSTSVGNSRIRNDGKTGMQTEKFGYSTEGGFSTKIGNRTFLEIPAADREGSATEAPSPSGR